MPTGRPVADEISANPRSNASLSATTVACAGGSSARQRPSSRRVSEAVERGHRVAVARGPLVGAQRLGAADRPRLREVLAGVHDEAVQPGRELRLAPELADPDDELRERVLGRVARVLRVAQEMQRDLLDARGVALAERRERGRVAGLGASHEDRIRETVVGEG